MTAALSKNLPLQTTWKKRVVREDWPVRIVRVVHDVSRGAFLMPSSPNRYVFGSLLFLFSVRILLFLVYSRPMSSPPCCITRTVTGSFLLSIPILHPIGLVRGFFELRVLYHDCEPCCYYCTSLFCLKLFKILCTHKL